VSQQVQAYVKLASFLLMAVVQFVHHAHLVRLRVQEMVRVRRVSTELMRYYPVMRHVLHVMQIVQDAVVLALALVMLVICPLERMV